MPISDYQPLTADVKFRNGSLTVRGLVLDDIALLMRLHLTDLDKLVALFEDGVNEDFAVAEFSRYAITLAKEAPGLVANMIALACDDADNVDDYRRLSLPIMVNAMETIAQLTFEEGGGPKKFVASLVTMLRGLRPPKTDLDI